MSPGGQRHHPLLRGVDGEPEHSWIDDLDLTAREAIFRAPDSDTTLSLPLEPMHGTVG